MLKNCSINVHYSCQKIDIYHIVMFHSDYMLARFSFAKLWRNGKKGSTFMIYKTFHSSEMYHC